MSLGSHFAGTRRQQRQWRSENNELVSRVGPYGVEDPIFGRSISGIDVLAEEREYDPADKLSHEWSLAGSDIAHHVKAKVNQYVIRQATRRARPGSQMPLAASSSTLELEAKSTGTSNMMLTGSVIARKTGTRR